MADALRDRIKAALDDSIDPFDFMDAARELLPLVLAELDRLEAREQMTITDVNDRMAVLEADLARVTAERDKLKSDNNVLAFENVRLAAKAKLIADIPETENRSVYNDNLPQRLRHAREVLSPENKRNYRDAFKHLKSIGEVRTLADVFRGLGYIRHAGRLKQLAHRMGRQ